MALESGEVYPETQLFTKRVTTDRVLWVARVLPRIIDNVFASVLKDDEELAPGILATHKNFAKKNIEHRGWAVFTRDIKVATRTPISTLMHMDERGELGVCVTGVGKYPQDTILNRETLRKNDRGADYQNGSLSVLYDEFNTRAVARVLTHYAYGLELKAAEYGLDAGIMERLTPFAVSNYQTHESDTLTELYQQMNGGLDNPKTPGA